MFQAQLEKEEEDWLTEMVDVRVEEPWFEPPSQQQEENEEQSSNPSSNLPAMTHEQEVRKNIANNYLRTGASFWLVKNPS